MQVPIEIDPLQEAPACQNGYAAEAESGAPAVAAPDLIPDLVYDLRLNGDSSDGFYRDVSRFSDQLLTEIDLRAGAAIGEYSRYVQSQLREAPRSFGEYSIELLTLGLALSQYAGAAESTPGWVVELARELFWLRRRSVQLKSVADLARAAIVRFFLLPHVGRKATAGPCSLDQLPRLIEWLQAAGEFEQEVVRLNNWRSFLSTLPRAEAAHWIEAAADLFVWFRREAHRALGAYTLGVPDFLAVEYADRGCREDQIFCGKEPVEYHLSMVAAEIMNRGLREDFERTSHRVVLVPACMRGAHADSCEARGFGVDIACAGCDPACAVNRITRRMKSLGVTVYLVPHSTGFSRWLERWQRVPGCGVTAVACLLNILPGGYEMRARGIASQCVPLDYPGCQKHWRRKGIVTSLNEDRLVQIVQTVASPSH
jgi:hypothetical protein